MTLDSPQEGLLVCADLTPELVRRALDGDADAQDRLIERLTPEIHFNVAKMLRSWRTGRASGRDLRQEIEDMVQEVFLELIEHDSKALRRWDPDRLNLCGYVSYIARIRTAEVLRSRRSPWRDDPTPDTALDRETPRENPEGETTWRDLLSKIVVCLYKRFTVDDAWLFDLLFVKQIPRQEVAKKTGKTPAAVYKWISRLYERARKCRDKLSK